MSSRRTAILIGAIAVGIVAVLLIVQYVNGIKSGIEGDAESVQVYFAQTDIKRGTDGSTASTDGSIAAASIPRKFYPATAIQSLDAIQKKVALFDIAANTVIVTGMFVDPSTTQITFRERLKSPTHVAISISTDAVHGVGGFLVPGDEVNMMIYQDNGKIKSFLETPIDESASSSAPKNPNVAGGPDVHDAVTDHPTENIVQVGGPQWIIMGKTARYMYQKVRIIAVGSSVALTPGEQAQTTSTSGTQTNSNSNVITLEVPPVAAQWIATGQDANFYLSLVAKDYKPKELRPLPIVVDVLPGEDPVRLCPYWDTTQNEEGCVK